MCDFDGDEFDGGGFDQYELNPELNAPLGRTVRYKLAGNALHLDLSSPKSMTVIASDLVVATVLSDPDVYNVDKATCCNVGILETNQYSYFVYAYRVSGRSKIKIDVRIEVNDGFILSGESAFESVDSEYIKRALEPYLGSSMSIEND